MSDLTKEKMTTDYLVKTLKTRATFMRQEFDSEALTGTAAIMEEAARRIAELDRFNTTLADESVRLQTDSEGYWKERANKLELELASALEKIDRRSHEPRERSIGPLDNDLVQQLRNWYDEGFIHSNALSQGEAQLLMAAICKLSPETNDHVPIKLVERMFNAACFTYPEWVMSRGDMFGPIREVLGKCSIDKPKNTNQCLCTTGALQPEDACPLHGHL